MGKEKSLKTLTRVTYLFAVFLASLFLLWNNMGYLWKNQFKKIEKKYSGTFKFWTKFPVLKVCRDARLQGDDVTGLNTNPILVLYTFLHASKN